MDARGEGMDARGEGINARGEGINARGEGMENVGATPCGCPWLNDRLEKQGRKNDRHIHTIG